MWGLRIRRFCSTKLDKVLKTLKEQLANGGISAAELEGEDTGQVCPKPSLMGCSAKAAATFWLQWV